MTARAPNPDPVLAAMNAALPDDRELSDPEREALAEARREIARGEGRVMSTEAVEAWLAARRRDGDG